MLFDESGSVIHRNIYVRNITGLYVVQRTPVDVGCDSVKVVFEERCCLPCWAALWSLALSETVYPASRGWLTDTLTPPAAKVRSTIGGQEQGSKYLLRLRLANVGEKYPWYDVRSNSSGWVLQYIKTMKTTTPSFRQICALDMFYL